MSDSSRKPLLKKNNLRDFFGLGFEEVRPDTERSSYVRIAAGIALPFTLLFSLVNYLKGHHELAAIELIIAVTLLLPALILARQKRWLATAESLIILYSLLITMSLASFGGIDGTGILWVFAFPFVAFLLKGQKTGWMINLVWMALMFISISQGHKISGTSIYSGAYTPQTYAAMLFFTMLAAAFSLVRSRFESLLNEQVKINTRKASERLQQLQYLASHDSQTGLPNLASLITTLKQKIETGSADTRLLLITLKLHRYNELTNIIGLDSAKQLTVAITKTIQTLTQNRILCIHEKHDEFILLHEYTDQTSADELIKKLRDELSLNYQIDSFDIALEHTLGAAVFPDNAQTTDELINRSDQALLHAMALNRNYFLYDSQYAEGFVRRHLLYGKLKKAMANNEIHLHYQPKFDLRSKRITGAESLARWTDSNNQSISPAEFIPIAENSGLIYSFTKQIISKGFQQQAEWVKKGIHIKMSLNLSVHNLLDDELIPHLQKLLSEYSLSPSVFVLEITEGSFTDFRDQLKITLNELHKIGFALSIDDFGTGYSSLSYLKDLPVDELKIDQSFIQNLFTDQRSEALVKSIIQIAHNLDLSIVAEGIEDDKTEKWLELAECETGQGFGFSRPLPPEDFAQFFSQHAP